MKLDSYCPTRDETVQLNNAAFYAHQRLARLVEGSFPETIDSTDVVKTAIRVASDAKDGTLDPEAATRAGFNPELYVAVVREALELRVGPSVESLDGLREYVANLESSLS